MLTLKSFFDIILLFARYKQVEPGEVSEWFMVLVLKTSVVHATVGSNPTFSAVD